MAERVVILNAGWGFKDKCVKFQSVHSNWAKAREAIIKYQNDQHNVYNTIELIEKEVDNSDWIASETWLLNNGGFYRDSVAINGVFQGAFDGIREAAT